MGESFYIPSRTVTEAQFLAFQAASGDNHPIHYDREYCRRHGHSELLAHGYQVLIQTAAGAGQFPFLVEDSLMGFIEQSSRFLKPVYAGDTLYPRLVVSELKPQRTTGVLTLSSTIHNQKRELVMEGMQKYLLKKRGKSGMNARETGVASVARSRRTVMAATPLQPRARWKIWCAPTAEPHRHYHTLTMSPTFCSYLDEHGGASDAMPLRSPSCSTTPSTIRRARTTRRPAQTLRGEQLSALGFPRQLLGQGRALHPGDCSMARRLRRSEMPTSICCSISICPCWLRQPIAIVAYAQAIRQEYAGRSR